MAYNVKRVNKRLYRIIQDNLNQGNSISVIHKYLNRNFYKSFKLSYKQLCNVICRSDLRHLAIAKKCYEHFRPSKLDNMHMYKSESATDYIFTFKPKREIITQRTNYKEELVHDLSGSRILMTGTNDIREDRMPAEEYAVTLIGDSITALRNHDFPLLGDNPPKGPESRANGAPSHMQIYKFKDLQNKEVNIKFKKGELTLEITW